MFSTVWRRRQWYVVLFCLLLFFVCCYCCWQWRWRRQRRWWRWSSQEVSHFHFCWLKNFLHHFFFFSSLFEKFQYKFLRRNVKTKWGRGGWDGSKGRKRRWEAKCQEVKSSLKSSESSKKNGMKIQQLSVFLFALFTCVLVVVVVVMIRVKLCTDTHTYLHNYCTYNYAHLPLLTKI